jgi:hypothetical protein
MKKHFFKRNTKEDKNFIRTVVVLGIVLVLSSAAMADQAGLSAKVKTIPSLIAHLPLEGDYRDASGNGNDGKEVGDPTAFGWTDGVNGGKALTIDSAKFIGSFIDIPAPIGSVFDTPQATAIVWVKLSPRDGDYWQAIAERNNFWYIETEMKPAEWKGNAVVYRIYDPKAPGGGGSDQLRDNANVTIEDEKWSQLAWTYDGAVLKGYLNGKQVLSKDYTGGLGPTADTPETPPAGKGKNYNFSLGTWQQRDDWFRGAIDDFAYFKDVLSETQIKELYEAMLAAPTAVTPQGKLATMWGAVKHLR